MDRPEYRVEPISWNMPQHRPVFKTLQGANDWVFLRDLSKDGIWILGRREVLPCWNKVTFIPGPCSAWTKTQTKTQGPKWEHLWSGIECPQPLMSRSASQKHRVGHYSAKYRQAENKQRARLAQRTRDSLRSPGKENEGWDFWAAVWTIRAW